MCQTITPFKVLQLSFKNDQDDFIKHSFIDIQKCLNKISVTWKAISFANEQKNFIFKETELKSIGEFLSLKMVQIRELSIEIIISCRKDLNENKRFMHHKHLISLEDEEILEYLKEQNVISLFRIKRKDSLGNKISTGSFIIQFNDTNIPAFLKVDWIQINVQRLEDRPMRCNHCFLIGHTIKKCRIINQTLCKACHYFVDVKYIDHHVCNQICKNCQLSHNSSSNLCPKYLEQKEVILLKEKYGISHQEAFLKVQLKENLENCDNKIEKICDKMDQMTKGLEDQLKETINSQQNEISELQATIQRMKQEHHSKVKEIITKHVQGIQQTRDKKENYLSMIDTVQKRNKYLDNTVEYLMGFVTSAEIISEYNKYKKKTKFDI